MDDQRSAAPIRLALAGSGVFARGAHVPSLAALDDRIEVVAVLSRTEDNARAAAALLPGEPDVYTDLDELLARDDIEAVDIVLPIPLLPDAVRRCLAAGKHVVSEKPVAGTSAEARDLIAFHARHPDRVWMVGENFRYEEAYVRAAELVRDGAIGTPVLCHWATHVPIHPGHRYHTTAWRRTGEVPGGFLLDAGVHFASAFRMVVGEIVQVTAETRAVRDDLPPADTLSATLAFENGALGTFAATFATGAPWPPSLHVAGDAGSLRILRDRIELARGTERREIAAEPASGVREELAAFAASIRAGTPHRNTAGEALADLRVVEALLESARSGRAQRIEPPGAAGGQPGP